jgi:hypothetical protein
MPTNFTTDTGNSGSDRRSYRNSPHAWAFRSDLAGQRCRKPQQLVPVVAERLGLALTGNEALEVGIAVRPGKRVHAPALEIAKARGKPFAEKREQLEDVIGGTTGIDKMLVEPQLGIMIIETVENIGPN